MAARLLNVKGGKHQTVQSWLRNRIPAEYCPAIERETRARGEVVPCEDLRPDIPWGVLRAQTTPTEVSPHPSVWHHELGGNLPPLRPADCPPVVHRTERDSVQVLHPPRTAPHSGNEPGPDASGLEAAHG